MTEEEKKQFQEEFVKLIEKADLDPIYYCETMKLCPSKCEIYFGCLLFDLKICLLYFSQ